MTRALLPFIDGPFGITRERLLAILEGMEMDLRQNRYLDFAALKRYCAPGRGRRRRDLRRASSGTPTRARSNSRAASDWRCS